MNPDVVTIIVAGVALIGTSITAWMQYAARDKSGMMSAIEQGDQLVFDRMQALLKVQGTRIAELEKVRSVLRDDINQLKDRIGELEKENVRLKVRVRELEKENHALKAHNDNLAKRLDTKPLKDD